MNDIYYIKYMNVRMCVGMYVFIYAYMCMYVYKNSIIRNITSYIHT